MNILVIDSYEIIRKGIKLVLQYELPEARVLEVEVFEEALVIAEKIGIDLIVVDVNFRGEDSLKGIELLREKGYKGEVLVLTSSLRKADYIKAKALDVKGYLLKTMAIEDIVFIIKQVQKGKIFYDSSIVEQGYEDSHEALKNMLTEREHEVFIEIGKGLTNQQISRKLFISENTTKKHITNILSKLQLQNRTEVALYASSMWKRKVDYKEEIS